MALLRVLGTVEIECDADRDEVRALLAKPKLTALAVYLLLAARSGWCRRDVLAALFWPDSDQARARASLSQALYQLRQHLGPAAVETRGSEEVRLAPGALTCDALELRRALAAGDDRTVCERYAGELLPAFHLADSAAFSHWLDGQRSALRGDTVAAAWRAAEDAERREDFTAARRYYRLAGELSLLDSTPVARAIAALSRIREPDAALRLFERHRDAMRNELDEEPDPGVVSLAEEIRGSGAGIVGDLDATPVSRTPTHRPATAQMIGLAGRRGWVLVPLLAVGALVAAILPRILPLRAAPPLDPALVAVLPFGYEGPGAEDRWLTTALPVGLMPLLDGTGGLRAVPEQRVAAGLAARGVDWGDALSAEQAREVAARVGAAFYLTGHVIRDAGDRYLTATLTETESGAVRQQIRFSLDSLDVLAAVERLSGELLIGLVEQTSRARELLSHSPDALREYVDGWVARRDARYVDAVRHFQHAMEADSTFVLAALGYREASMWLPDGTPHRRALPLADQMLVSGRSRLSAADRAVADAILETYRDTLDGRAALGVLREATLRAPDRPSAWLLLGDFLLHDGRMLALPHHTELAAAAFDSARALGTLTPEAVRHLIEIRFALGDTVAAREYLAAHPPDPEAFDHLWWTAASLVRDSTGLASFAERLEREPLPTLRWILYWSQRAGVGFEHADRAAALLEAHRPLDDSRWFTDQRMLTFYHLNRGRPHVAQRFESHRYPEPRQRPVRSLELALGMPETWVNLDSLAQDVETNLATLRPEDLLWAACHLGTWHAMRGRAATADTLAQALHRWVEDPDVRRRGYARVCPVIIRALEDTSPNLAAADSVLLSEPAGVLRADLTRWSLLVARAYRDRGHPDRGLPLTTRLGFIVEASGYQTPALLLEGELSLAVGDSARAARAYARAAAFLSDPEPTVATDARAAGIDLIDVRHVTPSSATR